MSSQYFSPYGSTNNIKVELNLANYATKDDVKNMLKCYMMMLKHT